MGAKSEVKTTSSCTQRATALDAHAQRYLVNGHPATAQEEQYLASYGFALGAWRMGWGISLDVAHADFVPEPLMPQCRYVLDVPLDCDRLLTASR